MSRRQLGKAQRLAQSDTTWQCTARRAYTWIFPKNAPPYRPYVVMVVDQDRDRVRASQITGDRPSPDDVFDTLLKAMLRPVLGSGRRYKPVRVAVDDAELAQDLAPNLSELGIGCDYRYSLPLLNELLREMATRLAGEEPIPGLLSMPGVTRPLVEELFTAAADYHRQVPWRWMSNAEPIELCFASQERTRYAIVLGSGEEVYGLVLYDSLDDLQLVFSSDEPEQLYEQIPWLSLLFVEPMALSFDDLDAIEKYDWPVADESAYPLAAKATGEGDFVLPSAAEIIWLAAALRAIPDFVVRGLQADRGPLLPSEATYALSDVYSNSTLILRYPTPLSAGIEITDDLLETLSEAHGQDLSKESIEGLLFELENFVEDWYSDEASYRFALTMAVFMFGFLGHLESTGLSSRTMNKHSRNCWYIGFFETNIGEHETFSPGIFVDAPPRIEEFKRMVSDAPYTVAGFKATWNKLVKYACLVAGEEQEE